MRISAAGPDGRPLGIEHSFFFADVVTQTEEGISIAFPEDFTMPNPYAIEMWIPRASCGEEPGPYDPYTYVTDTNSPELRAMWDVMYWENIMALSNRQPSQVEWPTADELRPYMGKWVAITDAAVVFSADHPRAVVQHLWDTGQRADSMFRVPTAEEHDEHR